MLGILKAGKAFVLLDSRLPPDRLRWTIEDSQTRLIIHQKQHESLLKKVGLDRRFLDLNSIGPSDSMENIEVGISPTDFAAVFYTSGSTGDTKGVIQTHRNILQTSCFVLTCTTLARWTI